MSLEKRLISYIEQYCQEKKECIIDLHKAVYFDWDKAYFFYKYDKKTIQGIVNTDFNFVTDLGTQIVFTYNDQVVAYQEIPLPVVDAAFIKNIPKERINIEFRINKNNLNDLNYTNYFLLDPIYYYLLLPSNDKLKVTKEIIKIGNVSQKIFTIYPTNLQQVLIK